MAQQPERISYEERNRQREERVLQHDRALNASRQNAKNIKDPQGGETPEEAAKIFQRRRKVAIVLGVLAIVALIHVLLSQKREAPNLSTELPDSTQDNVSE
jgi:hypothetical protein